MEYNYTTARYKAARKVVRSTAAQIRCMVEFMNTHRNLANTSHGPLAMQFQREGWTRLKNLLREYGPDKSIGQWRITWKDLKKRAKDQEIQMREAFEKGQEQPELPSQTKTILEILNSEEAQSSIQEGAPEPELESSVALATPLDSRCTPAQIRFLVDYMNSHRHLAHSPPPGQPDTQFLREEWNTLKEVLAEYGPDKSVEDWKNTWGELKKKAIWQEARLKVPFGKGGEDELPSQTRTILEIINGVDSQEEGFGPEETSIDISGDPAWSPQVKIEIDAAGVTDGKGLGTTKSNREDPLENGDEEYEDEQYVEMPVDETVEYSECTEKHQKRNTKKTSHRRRRSTSSSNSDDEKVPPKKKKSSKDLQDPMVTLNQFIQYEREKEQLAHSREMSRIAQNERVLNMVEKFVNIVETLTPSIKKYLDKHIDENR